jgi:hypothetical protein
MFEIWQAYLESPDAETCVEVRLGGAALRANGSNRSGRFARLPDIVQQASPLTRTKGRQMLPSRTRYRRAQMGNS